MGTGFGLGGRLGKEVFAVDYNQLTSPRTVKSLMEQYQVRFKKRFGQNFLVDRNILQKITACAQLQPDQFVLEIGTGLGALTYALAQACRQVLTFEIDPDLAAIFRENQALDNIHLVCGDALKYDWGSLLRTLGWNRERVSLVANLPYYATSPLIVKALESGIPFDPIVVMVQKEVAERMQAAPGTKDYGLLTLMIQYYADVEITARVPRTVFIPPPEVDSAVVRLSPRPPRVQADQAELFAVIRAAFSQRRKTLRNTLQDLCRDWGISGERLDEILTEMNLPPAVRGEALSLEQFGILTQKLTASKK